MMNWTDEARNELERFLVAERAWLAADPDSGDMDHEEVIGDLRAHIHEELAVLGAEEVDLHRLQEVLGRLRPGFGCGDEPRPRRKERASDSKRKTRERRPGPVLWFCGVVLPLVALIAELSMGICASELGGALDPIPTLYHALGIALVPVMNALMLSRMEARQLGGSALMTFAGMALLVGTLYAVLFIPLVPIAAVALFFGIGLLPLAPLFSVLVTAFCIRKSKKMGAPKGALAGFVLAAVIALLVEVPAMCTSIGANLAASEDADKSARGVDLIRSYGSESMLLSMCYGVQPASLLLPMTKLTAMRFLEEDNFGRANSTKARTTYFLVTGIAFNAVQVPPNVEGRLDWARLQGERSEQGGDEVAGRVEGLSLMESRIDTVVETGASLAYTEWELQFSNRSDSSKEARAQVSLPPGGFVSRLTLWVDGEEREAAFDSRVKVKQAYRDVAIVRRRDPVLVSTSGEDLILVQCFPVLPGKEMRIRVGITSPLQLSDTAEGREGILSLPSFVERNFDIATSLQHEVWVQGASDFLVTPEGIQSVAPASGPMIARGSLSDGALSDPASVIRVSLEGAPKTSWVEEDFYDKNGAILQTLSEELAQPVGRLVFVLDGGAGMRQAAQDLAYAFSLLPRDIEVSLAICGEGQAAELDPKRADPAHIQSMISRLEEHDFEGGVLSGALLARAFDAVQIQGDADDKGPGAVIWLHGEQAVNLAGSSAISQRLTRARDGTRLFAVRGIGGVHRLAAELGSLPNFERVPREGELTNDLAGLVRKLTLGGPQPVLVRKHIDQAEVPEDARRVSRNLARVWAGDESVRLQATSVTEDRDEGIELALAHHLVTRATGAVVLESAEQYERHGLEPVKIDSVPSVPEPETWAMLAMVAGLLAFAIARGRSAA